MLATYNCFGCGDCDPGKTSGLISRIICPETLQIEIPILRKLVDGSGKERFTVQFACDSVLDTFFLVLSSTLLHHAPLGRPCAWFWKPKVPECEDLRELG